MRIMRAPEPRTVLKKINLRKKFFVAAKTFQYKGCSLVCEFPHFYDAFPSGRCARP